MKSKIVFWSVVVSFAVACGIHTTASPVCAGTDVYASWVQGNVTQVEYPARLGKPKQLHIGWGARFWGKENTSNWFHIPVTTPVIVENVRTQLKKVFVLFKTYGDAKVTSVHVYDGDKLIKFFDNLSITGSHMTTDASNTFNVIPNISVRYGLSLAVRVEFGAKTGSDFASILFTSAGVDLNRVTP